MKRAALILLLVPMLLFAGSMAGPLDPQSAYAQMRGGGGRAGHFAGGGGFRGGGFRGGGFRGGGGGHFHHGGGFRGGVFIGGPWWWWDPFYYPFYPYYAYPYPYYSSPSVVIEQPEEYVAPAPQSQQSYWYYCKDAKGYYPYVKRCPGGWMKVVPSATPPEDLNE